MPRFEIRPRDFRTTRAMFDPMLHMFGTQTKLAEMAAALKAASVWHRETGWAKFVASA